MPFDSTSDWPSDNDGEGPEYSDTIYLIDLTYGKSLFNSSQISILLDYLLQQTVRGRIVPLLFFISNMVEPISFAEHLTKISIGVKNRHPITSNIKIINYISGNYNIDVAFEKIRNTVNIPTLSVGLPETLLQEMRKHDSKDNG